MANNRYGMMTRLFALVHETKIHLEDLKALIRVHMATRDVVIRDILKDMVLLGFIKEDSTKPFYYIVIKNGNK